MDQSKPGFKRILRSIVGLVASIAAIGLTLQVIRFLLQTLGPAIARNEIGIPLMWQWQVVSLASGFVAGVVGAGVLTVIVIWRTQAHLAVWMIIGFIVDGLVISRVSPPVWFSTGMLAGIPIQALLGYLLASRLFRNRVEPSRA